MLRRVSDCSGVVYVIRVSVQAVKMSAYGTYFVSVATSKVKCYSGSSLLALWAAGGKDLDSTTNRGYRVIHSS